jgi:hypothetical protein
VIRLPHPSLRAREEDGGSGTDWPPRHGRSHPTLQSTPPVLVSALVILEQKRFMVALATQGFKTKESTQPKSLVGF